MNDQFNDLKLAVARGLSELKLTGKYDDPDLAAALSWAKDTLTSDKFITPRPDLLSLRQTDRWGNGWNWVLTGGDSLTPLLKASTESDDDLLKELSQRLTLLSHSSVIVARNAVDKEFQLLMKRIGANTASKLQKSSKDVKAAAKQTALEEIALEPIFLAAAEVTPEALLEGQDEKVKEALLPVFQNIAEDLTYELEKYAGKNEELSKRIDENTDSAVDKVVASIILAALVLLGKGKNVAPTPGALSSAAFGAVAAISGGLLVTDENGYWVLGEASTLGSGPVVTEWLESSFGTLGISYVWQTGRPLVPFPPHQRLQGLVFSANNFPANDSDFPPFAAFFPGDHYGCRCYLIIIFSKE